MEIDKLLKSIPDKREDKNTTSHTFKRDLYKFFTDPEPFLNYIDKKVLEVSCYKGHTTRILSHLFGEVYAVDFNEEYLEDAKELNKDRDNIIFTKLEIYNEPWEFPQVEVVFLDADHQYEAVIKDTQNACKLMEAGGIIVYDDYGLPGSYQGGVKRAVDEMLEENEHFNIMRYIGEPEGSECRVGKKLVDWEGIIIQYG